MISSSYAYKKVDQSFPLLYRNTVNGMIVLMTSLNKGVIVAGSSNVGQEFTVNSVNVEHWEIFEGTVTLKNKT